MRVCVLGTGTMGAGMTRALIAGGHEVRVWNRTPGKAKPLAKAGASVADSVAEAIDGAAVVITMLFDADAVLDVAAQFAGHLGSDAVWLQTSTIGVEGAARVDAFAVAHRLTVLDVPVLGTKEPAEKGELVVLASGDPTVRVVVAPVLDAIGTKTIWAGDSVGDASALKLAGNAWIASITAATAQSLALALALGVEPQLFLDAIAGGPSDTPYAQMKGGKMLSGDFAPSFALDGIRKDLDLIRSAAGITGVDTALLDALTATYGKASADGRGADDISAVYTAVTAT